MDRRGRGGKVGEVGKVGNCGGVKTGMCKFARLDECEIVFPCEPCWASLIMLLIVTTALFQALAYDAKPFLSVGIFP